MQKPYNISLYPGTGGADGRRGDHIILAPAYNVTSEEIRQIVETVNTVVRQFFLRHTDEWFPSARILEPQAPALVAPTTKLARR